MKIPKHVALIMDGNRRWAKKQGLSLLRGHKTGEERIEPIIDKALELGIKYLTFWAFSTENWNRSKKEVEFLLKLYREDLDKKIDGFHRKSVKINVIGNLAMFPSDIQEKTREWMKKTKNNHKITVNLALSYGGRDEILRANEKLLEKSKIKNQKSKLTEEEFSRYLDTAGQPDPELIIRTGGEKRLSGFLLWQSEYSELYFSEIFWPEFTADDFLVAIKDYNIRQRRLGR